MRRFLRNLSAVWAALGIAAVAWLGLELVLSAFGSEGGAPLVDVANTDALADQAQAAALFDELYSGRLQHRFEPFAHYRMKAYAGQHVNVNADGWRATPTSAADGPTVWVLGGSTIWGMGARDEGTIPSHLARALRSARVENLGQIGYTSTQELITLLARLQAGERPDVVVFYDGVNDLLSLLKLGRAGLPLDVPRRELEFNITRPDELPRLLKATVANVARKSKVLGLVRGTGERQPARPIEDPERAAQDALRAYLANVAAAQGLAERYGFEVMFFWQPTLFGKAKLSASEKAALAEEASFAPVYRAAQAQVATSTVVVDLSDVFGEDPAPTFFDFCHLSEAGNLRVADRIAQVVAPVLEGR
ncbi:MAG: SGNH/GDSL hydrolase family protein [Deltaproteobacteria bacterium]|jgi:lysophospholipase L1-like esterase